MAHPATSRRSAFTDSGPDRRVSQRRGTLRTCVRSPITTPLTASIPDDVVVDPPQERSAAPPLARPAPGFTGFSAPSRSGPSPAPLRSSAPARRHRDPTALTDDERLGVFDDLEVLQRSIDAIGVMVLTEIDDRDQATPATGPPRRVRTAPRPFTGDDRASGVPRVRWLRRDLPDAAALARGEITGERALYVASKPTTATPTPSPPLSRRCSLLSAAEPSFAQFCVLVTDLARFAADADGAEDPDPVTSSAQLHRADDEVVLSATYVDVDGELFEQPVEAATNALWRRWRRPRRQPRPRDADPDPGPCPGATRAGPAWRCGRPQGDPADRHRPVARGRRRPARRAGRVGPDPGRPPRRHRTPRRPAPSPLRRERPRAADTEVVSASPSPARTVGGSPFRPAVGDAGLQRLGASGGPSSTPWACPSPSATGSATRLRPCAAVSSSATEGAPSRGATIHPSGATPTTSCTGPTTAARSWSTSSCCAGATTEWSTGTDGRCRPTTTGPKVTGSSPSPPRRGSPWRPSTDIEVRFLPERGTAPDDPPIGPTSRAPARALQRPTTLERSSRTEVTTSSSTLTTRMIVASTLTCGGNEIRNWLFTWMGNVTYSPLVKSVMM